LECDIIGDDVFLYRTGKIKLFIINAVSGYDKMSIKGSHVYRKKKSHKTAESGSPHPVRPIRRALENLSRPFGRACPIHREAGAEVKRSNN